MGEGQMTPVKINPVQVRLDEWGWAEGVEAQQQAAFRWAEAVTAKLAELDRGVQLIYDDRI